MPLFSQAANIPQGWTPPQKDDEITLQIGSSGAETLDVARYYMGSKELLLDKTDFTSVDKANDSIQYLDNAIEAVSDVRASFGAAYNHLQRTHNNLSVTTENMTAAESQIRDTNMAQEFTDYTAANIQLRVSDSMLSQANALPDLVLKILNS